MPKTELLIFSAFLILYKPSFPGVRIPSLLQTKDKPYTYRFLYQVDWHHPGLFVKLFNRIFDLMEPG